MKKYIAITMLLAAGSAFANAAVGDVFMLDSKLSYNGQSESAFNLLQGQDKDDRDLGYCLYDQLSWKGGNEPEDFSINTSGLLTQKSVQLGVGEYYSIDTISFASRYGDHDKVNYPAELTFVYDGVTYTATASYDYKTSGQIGIVNFKLDVALTTTTLDLGDIGVSISCADAVETSQFGIAVAQGSEHNGVSGTLSGTTPIFNGVWNPVIRISGTVIPEPSTFGLLAGLGALALVGTRRRRR